MHSQRFKILSGGASNLEPVTLDGLEALHWFFGMV
jgi:hypothetical protein